MCLHLRPVFRCRHPQQLPQLSIPFALSFAGLFSSPVSGRTDAFRPFEPAQLLSDADAAGFARWVIGWQGTTRDGLPYTNLVADASLIFVNVADTSIAQEQ